MKGWTEWWPQIAALLVGFAWAEVERVDEEEPMMPPPRALRGMVGSWGWWMVGWR